MQKNCKQCGSQFEILNEDSEFYKKCAVKVDGQIFQMPEPNLCFACRHQKRLSFRNEMALYHRKCDKTGKQIISMYSPDKPYVVYDQEEWWGDNWDPFEYGRDFDFSRPFFEQFAELQKVVPRMSLNNINPENSEYCNLACDNKNCYLIFTADYNENCAYLRFGAKDFQCFDCDRADNSSECYESLEIDGCTRCFYAFKAKNCSELMMCYNMTSCHDCIGCANLVNKRNCIFNEQYSKQDYDSKKKELNLSTYSGVTALKKKYDEFLKKQIRKYVDIMNCENCLGDHLRDCKNSYLCYDSQNLEDCRYIVSCVGPKNCYDWDFYGGTGSIGCHEMVSSAYDMVNCHFCANSWNGNSDMYYSELCLGNQNLFGCIGMRHKKYCILNKQYSKEEYEKLVAKIITHMQKTGEWGEFFPEAVSPFAYNETIAFEYFPLSKEEAHKKGLQWYEDESEKMYKGAKYDIPDDIKDVKDDICKAILTCEETKKPYKIIPQELLFLKKVGLPVPRFMPRERYLKRVSQRNPLGLFQRNCSKCEVEMYSSYSPERPEPVYCEKCYLEAVF